MFLSCEAWGWERNLLLNLWLLIAKLFKIEADAKCVFKRDLILSAYEAVKYAAAFLG